MNANGIKATDREHIAGELQQLLDEQAQLRASLAEQNVDPELIECIRHCVDTVIKAGEEPRQRESIRAQLQKASKTVHAEIARTREKGPENTKASSISH